MAGGLYAGFGEIWITRSSLNTKIFLHLFVLFRIRNKLTTYSTSVLFVYLNMNCGVSYRLK